MRIARRIAELLIRKGANVDAAVANALTMNRPTILFDVIHNGWDDVAEMILSRSRASVNSKELGRDGSSPRRSDQSEANGRDFA